ncbi:MAG: VWA domain-containing protein [Acidobacteria bacterium]|nr:VWA domain-containing protein [Acidobacteriota bacterium]MBA3885359.1 VWA domain-containing protein [Acidobacteriota bacterium]
MTRRMGLLGLVMLALASIVVTGQQRFRGGIELVHFGVVVTDRSGTPITGLTAADFEVRERGTKQTIQHFAAGEPDAMPPLHLGFLLDLSGSMERDIKDVRTAAIRFLSAVDTAVDVTLVDFDTEVRMARFAADDFPRLIERIRMRSPGGWTAFYDAFATYLHGTSEQTGQKIAVVYTDGADTRSTLNRGEVLELLKVADVTVYVIGYLEGQSSSSRLTQRQLLGRFSDATGGRAFFPASLREIDKIYDQIRGEIMARYSIGYVSTDERADGAWRDVEIRLTRKDLPGARVRTRGGYFAPYRPAQP